MIIDATFPYKTNQERYICSLKIVDPSIYVKGKENEFATLVLYAKRFEDLPIITRLGDVIRVHRATLRLYNGQRQFNANIFYNSSWAIFPLDSNKHEASGNSSKSYSQQQSELATLNNIRQWAQKYFAQYNAVAGDTTVTLSKAAGQKSDFDVVAKVAQVFELDEYTNELRLRDTSTKDAWNVLALKLKFPHIKTGDVVRVRSVTYDETSTQKKVLLLSHYSNILSFPAGSKLGKEIKGKASDEKVDKAAITGSSATVLTEVDKKWAGLPVHSLQDLFHNVETDKEIQSKDTFRT